MIMNGLELLPAVDGGYVTHSHMHSEHFTRFLSINCAFCAHKFLEMYFNVQMKMS